MSLQVLSSAHRSTVNRWSWVRPRFHRYQVPRISGEVPSRQPLRGYRGNAMIHNNRCVLMWPSDRLRTDSFRCRVSQQLYDVQLAPVTVRLPATFLEEGGASPYHVAGSLHPDLSGKGGGASPLPRFYASCTPISARKGGGASPQPRCYAPCSLIFPRRGRGLIALRHSLSFE